MNYYHYCSVETMLSIISNKEIWLTDSYHANDEAEGKYIDEIYAEVLKEEGISDDFAEKLKQDHQKEEPHCSSYSLSHWRQSFNYYLFCLSTDPDSLSQWRGYANGAKGFSIGFSKPFMENIQKRTDHFVDFYKVVYLKNRQKELIKEKALKIFALLSENNGFSEDKIKEMINFSAFGLSTFITDLMYAFKHPNYAEEKEVRLVAPFYKEDNYDYFESQDFNDPSILKFYSVDDKLKAYIPITLKDGDIKEIWLGPKNQTKEDDVSFCLENAGFKNVIIKRSKTSYR